MARPPFMGGLSLEVAGDALVFPVTEACWLWALSPVYLSGADR